MTSLSMLELELEESTQDMTSQQTELVRRKKRRMSSGRSKEESRGRKRSRAADSIHHPEDRNNAGGEESSASGEESSASGDEAEFEVREGGDSSQGIIIMIMGIMCNQFLVFKANQICMRRCHPQSVWFM